MDLESSQRKGEMRIFGVEIAQGGFIEVHFLLGKGEIVADGVPVPGDQVAAEADSEMEEAISGDGVAQFRFYCGRHCGPGFRDFRVHAIGSPTWVEILERFPEGVLPTDGVCAQV